jgi:UDP-N-acetylmuramate dehydrogenase
MSAHTRPARHLSPALREELVARVRGLVRFEVPLSRHTTWRVGGPAEALVWPADEADLASVLRFASTHALPWFVLGAGSNLLVQDGGIPGIVISLERGLRRLEASPPLVIAEAGCRIGRLLAFCAARGIAGLEFLAEIPGTVGGAVVMNAGAMGGEVKGVLRWVDLLLSDGTLQRLFAQSIPFAYRHSELPAGSVVVRAALETREGDPREVKDRISSIRRARRAAQPAGATAGSTFKNPPGDFAGRLLEAAGLKGRAVGAAIVSERHANFIVNRGGATAREVLKLIRLMEREVFARFQVRLELEVKVVGEP